MKTRDLERLLARMLNRMDGSEMNQCLELVGESMANAIAAEDDAAVLHLAGDDLHRLGDRIDVSVSRVRRGVSVSG